MICVKRKEKDGVEEMRRIKDRQERESEVAGDLGPAMKSNGVIGVILFTG